jgi:hypothetical protein
MQSAKSESELHEILRSLLRESMRLHTEGASGVRLGHADGYVDGFVRALVESGLADQASVLAIIKGVRREHCGAALGELETDSATLAA